MNNEKPKSNVGEQDVKSLLAAMNARELISLANRAPVERMSLVRRKETAAKWQALQQDEYTVPSVFSDLERLLNAAREFLEANAAEGLLQEEGFEFSLACLEAVEKEVDSFEGNAEEDLMLRHAYARFSLAQRQWLYDLAEIVRVTDTRLNEEALRSMKRECAQLMTS